MKNIFTTSPVKLLLTLLLGFAFNVTNAQTPSVFLLPQANQNVTEGNVFTFSAHLTMASTTNVVINFSTAPGTATTADFSPLSSTVTIAAGQLSSSPISIPTTNDPDVEGNEHFFINANVTSGNTLNTSGSLVVTIVDNDAVPTLNLAPSYNLIESYSTSVYYGLSNPFHSDVVINFATVAGSASTADFVVANTTVTIPAGQIGGTFAVSTLDDSLIEANETFNLTATVTSGNTINPSSTCVFTIIDNDVTPTVSVNSNPVAYEGNGFTYFAYLDRNYNSPVTINFTTTNGTAGSGDFTATTITRTIAAGYRNTSFSIPIIDDTLDEPYENFTVTGTVTSGNTTNTTVSSIVNIVDNDGLPDFSITNGNDMPFGAPATVEEGSDAEYLILLTDSSDTDTVIQIATANGTAGSLDYSPVTTTITVPAGSRYFRLPSFIVPTILDQLQESDETFTINGTLLSGNMFNTNASLTYTILDNYNINAQPDDVISVAEVGTTFNLFANDTYHGLPLNTATATVALATNSIGATVDASGIITIPSSVPIGYYQLNYTICEIANPASCDTASITVEVQSPLDVTYNLTYSDYNGDGFTSVGDIITYQFDVTNNGNAPITNIAVDNMYNITVIGGPIASLGSGQTDSTTFTATHIITQDDINYGNFGGDNQNLELSFIGTYHGYQVEDWAELGSPFSLNISDGIRLKAFVDTNGNGVQDSSEINFPLGHFKYEINNNGTIHNLYSTPYYLYESNPTTTYDLTYEIDSQYAAVNTCAASYSNITVVPGSGITDYNFPITVTPYQDLSVNIHNNFAPPRPGFMHYYYISYTNNSNLTVPFGTLTFIKDPAITTAEVCDNNAVITPSGFTYNFTNLLPYQTRIFWVRMAVATIPTVSLGQLITNSVSITLPSGDILPLNNTSSVTETIVGSYDPNDKTESHGGKIVQSGFSANDYLTYTIRFENTGTANAINVRVTDLLDDKLDETTIKMVDASHTYALERVGKNLTWNFFAIDLPPSEENTMVGHGYIVFQIKPKTGYVIGDVITNTAEIYFDFNPAIVTEPCITEFVQSLDNDAVAFENFECYPNPTKDYVTLSNSATIDTVEIVSVLGQTINTVKIDDLQTKIDLSGLTNGMYFLKVSSNGQEKTVKVLKD